MYLEKAKKANFYSPGVYGLDVPDWMLTNTHYECIMGSFAYGCSELGKSDYDIYGFAIPRKEVIFPHLAGYIPGFGKKPQGFEQLHTTAVKMNNEGVVCDFTIYSIIKFFQLCMENNPNMVDALFVPDNCITHITEVGTMVRDARKRFLHKGCWHKFKGYAYSQMHKAKSMTREGKRAATVEQFGYDIKFAYHIVRLLDECEQILVNGDLVLGRNAEEMKAIRRGEWKLSQVEYYFTYKEKYLEKLYQESALPYGPDEKFIKQLLLDCLEHHYGNLDTAIRSESKAERQVEEIRRILNA